MNSYMKDIIFNFICFLIDVRIYLNNVAVSIFIFILKNLFLKNTFYKNHDTKLLYARTSTGIDVTNIVSWFYRLDNVLSCATLQMWLAKFDINCSNIYIIFYREYSLQVSVLDLTRDIETKLNVENSDVDLCVLNSTDVLTFARKNEYVEPY
jgi:hypothetical protein